MYIISHKLVHTESNKAPNTIVPRSPPPSSSHIFCKASCSRRFFSSFGIPSEGVISPTMAIQWNQRSSFCRMIKHMVKKDWDNSTIMKSKVMLDYLLSNFLLHVHNQRYKSCFCILSNTSHVKIYLLFSNSFVDAREYIPTSINTISLRDMNWAVWEHWLSGIYVNQSYHQTKVKITLGIYFWFPSFHASLFVLVCNNLIITKKGNDLI